MKAPYISREDVSAALASLIHKTRKPGGLHHLLLVDLLVNAPAMPASDEARDFALRELLVSEITGTLSEQRTTFRLDPLDEAADIDEAKSVLVQVGEIGAHELMVWSVLYYRYVRSELAFPADEMAALIAVHPRTFSRYNDDGISFLTERLIAAEQEARLRQQERRLYAALPYSVPVRMVGRDVLLNSTEAKLPTLSPCHLMVTGATGIGKTTFVQELLRRQITAGRLDYLIWIDQPESVSFVRQQIAESILREGGGVTLRDALLMYTVAVVLDGIDRAVSDRATFNSLLRDLGAALVFLINRAYMPLEGIEAHLSLPEIDRDSTYVMIDDALRLQNEVDANGRQEIADDLFAQVGGNPLALKLSIGLWVSGEDWKLLRSEVHERLFGQVFAALADEEKVAWCALALFPRRVRLDDLRALWQIAAESVGTLMRLSVVERSGEDTYLLVGAAREYVRQQYAREEEVRQRFDYLIATMGEAEPAFDILEQMLLTGFPVYDQQRTTEWIDLLWKRVERRDHWARWRTILENYLGQVATISPELRIAYGICLRRLSDWEGAHQVFYNVVAECGRGGRFAEQARALIEWSVVARYQGDYQRAQGLIAQAKRYAQRANDAGLLQSLRLQEAQMLIQRGKGAEAYKLLAALPESAQVLRLLSEAQLALGNDKTCRTLAQRARIFIQGDEAAEASLSTIIGRSYEHEGNSQQAHRCFTDAVTLLERLGDGFTLARAQTNLAAVLIPMGRLSDAGTLLRQAEEVQSRLGDKVGLNATRHNWSILGGYIAR